MKKTDIQEMFDKYLTKNMDELEITEFEQLLQKNPTLRKDFLIERSIYKVAQDNARLDMKNRFAKLEKERSSMDLAPKKTMFDQKMQWVARAAFMHQSELNSTSLPVADDTISDFLMGEE